jgi:hypothetical protein
MVFLHSPTSFVVGLVVIALICFYILQKKHKGDFYVEFYESFTFRYGRYYYAMLSLVFIAHVKWNTLILSSISTFSLKDMQPYLPIKIRNLIQHLKLRYNSFGVIIMFKAMIFCCC